MEKHTPTPYRVQKYNGSYEIVTDKWEVASGSIGDKGCIRKEEDAAFIVRACNSHQLYQDALELIAAGIADPVGIAKAALSAGEGA